MVAVECARAGSSALTPSLRLSHSQTASTASVLAGSCLPYSLFDQLLALKADDTSAALSKEELQARQKELRDAVEARAKALEKAGRAALR